MYESFSIKITRHIAKNNKKCEKKIEEEHLGEGKNVCLNFGCNYGYVKKCHGIWEDCVEMGVDVEYGWVSGKRGFE